jgi:hypothetical protein
MSKRGMYYRVLRALVNATMRASIANNAELAQYYFDAYATMKGYRMASDPKNQTA